MKKLDDLQPNSIWKNFANICEIPRPSGKEKQIADYIEDFGHKLGLDTKLDHTGNVLIRKPAGKGYENKKTVVLQAHLDMVPQKNSDKAHDFEKDPIVPVIDGEWVTADGTTLGADNGMGVAAAMSILQSQELEHGPLEVLFTVDEETGMTGALGLANDLIQGDIMLNLDSEQAGELYIGCAGGVNFTAESNIRTHEIKEAVKSFQIHVKGLKGGHSGMDIILERGNANQVMARFIWEAMQEFNICLSELEGGDLRNAIPREAFALISVPQAEENEFRSFVTGFENKIKNELATTDPGFAIAIADHDTPQKCYDSKDLHRFISSVYACPNGVIRLSPDMPEIPETSTNLAVVRLTEEQAEILCLLRSSVDTAKENLANRMKALFELANMKVTLSGAYPGWQPDMNSPILKVMRDVYKNQDGKDPELKVIHAGLECGVIGGAYPYLDMISFGPTIKFPHSPDEKVHIPSVERFWNVLTATLKGIPEK
mgnify:CR=1 FL=1